jgi:transcriptional regulator with XRE-family HTH domain
MIEKLAERLEEERKRLGLNKMEMAAAGHVSPNSYTYYIQGLRVPDASVLAAWHEAGVDILYLVTHVRATGQLTVDEQDVLHRYNQAPLAVKAAVLGALTAGSAMNTVTQTIQGSVAQQTFGQVKNEGPLTFEFQAKTKK